MNYQETLDFLYEQLPMFQRVGDQAYKKDLSNTLALLESIGNPHHSLRSIHIAGTNGKGSVTHILAAVLQETGLRVACYTSPHYKDFRERIKINGELIPESFIVEFVSKNLQSIQKIQPSFFEITVVMAFAYFAEAGVDVAVIETGMGGRLDSTNVINPLLSIITNISFDHQQFLGDTLAKIAFEKAGIIKPSIPVLIGELQSETHPVFIKRAHEDKSDLNYAKDLVAIQDFTSSFSGSSFRLVFEDKILDLKTDLSGEYQEKNIRTALAAIELLRDQFSIDDRVIINGLQSVRTKTYFLGRSMQLNEKPLVVLESAHNEAGIKELTKTLGKTEYNKLHFVYGTVADKDLSQVFPLLPVDASYYFCQANIPRAMPSNLLIEKARLYGLQGSNYPSVELAYRAALQQASQDDMVLVSGSIFVVAELL
ncbi:bifunctional folylpolyglutamate synthase/dihydrofolate synthase [Chitinophagales bacterium]|nr:bifunctional folylpolyglutamate synthase/dihydrofolate synthase [Chitinophagales bacterium]